ncbi:MAG: hypothetical protein RL219_899 [Actinomycetota bacterium]
MSKRTPRNLSIALLLTGAVAVTVACSTDSDTTGSATTSARTTNAASSVATTGNGSVTSPNSTATPTPPQDTLAPKDIRLALQAVGTVETPTAFAVRAADPTLFVTSQSGTVHALRGGQPTVTVLDLGARMSVGGEEGLLGIAFSPDGSEAYLHYTDTNGDIQIDAFSVGEDGVFDPDSRRPILNVPHPENSNHNGGQLVVDAEGMLYIGVGDGGGGGDPQRNALDRSTLLGKILRIDPAADGNAPYRIPEDNPFYAMSSARNEIWAYGFRNPWRFSFDRLTGDFWVGDVGQRTIEEIDFVSAADGAGSGANFGWSAYEGSRRFNDDQPNDNTVKPVHEYRHGDGSASVIGGFVYRGSAIPALYGAYVFGDQVRSVLWALRLDGSGDADVAQVGAVETVSSFGEDNDGELYALSYSRGTVYRIVAA